MDRNLLLAIIFSIVIIVGFQYAFQAVSPPPPKKSPETHEVVKGTGVTTPSEKPAKEPVQATERIPETKAVPEVVRPADERGAAQVAELRVKVESPKYEAVLSSRGGRIISFKLKDYTASLGGSELVNLFEPDGPDTAGPSIMFTRRDETFNDTALAYTYESGKTEVQLTEQGASKSLTFQVSRPDGLIITKTYTFHADSYAVDFSFSLTNNSGEERNYLLTFPWRKAYRGESSTQQFSWNSAEILLNGVLKDYYFKDIKGDEEPSGQVKWAGLGDVYFFKAMVFGEDPAGKVRLLKPSPEGFAEIWVRFGAVDVPAGQKVEKNLALYFGPKERHALQAAGHDLSAALFYSNYWLLDVTAEYLLRFLRFCNNGFEVFGIRIPGTHNYGIDIIILTIIIKILFIPLTHKSMKSMKRMQDLQPQIAKLREKFKDDKAALNKATMELFREQKVNPLGSCWPMFLQLPVFVALYQALSYAIELRHASFVCFPKIYFCVADLSGPDPYYVTPVLMGATMVLQQWMTPSGGDPMQKKMMLIMPVVLTYVFLTMPSGLVLYWLINNVLSIGQQVITNKMAR